MVYLSRLTSFTRKELQSALSQKVGLNDKLFSSGSIPNDGSMWRLDAFGKRFLLWSMERHYSPFIQLVDEQSENMSTEWSIVLIVAN